MTHEPSAAQFGVNLAQLAAILGGITDGVTVQDAEGRLVYANDAAARMTGYATGEAMVADWNQTSFARFVMADEAGQSFAPERLPGRAALAGREAPEVLIRFRVVESGQERWSILSSAPIRDTAGRVQFAVNIFRDITERKQAEDAARFLSSASRLLAESLDIETTLQQIADLAVPTLADWCVVDLAEEKQLRRLALAHVAPERVALARELQARYPDDPQGSTGVGAALRTGRSQLVEEITSTMIESSARDADHLRLLRALDLHSAMIVPLVARGHTLGAITLIAAESGRRYRQADLLLAEQLAQRAAMALDNAWLYRDAHEQADAYALLNSSLREVIGERDDAVRRLEDSLRAREEFLAAAAHDLKNPLAGIKANVQLLERRARANRVPEPAQLADELRRIDAAATRAAAQVEELLDLARLQMGRTLELDRTTVDLVQLVREVASDYEQRTVHHQVHVDAEPEWVAGNWDRARLARVIGNLLDNAIRYSPEGGAVRVRLGVDTAEATEIALVVVQDVGLGIPAADLPLVFERFHRGGNVRAHISGTGLGLASARSIVEAHGGTIHVASVEGRGTTFTVRLPVHVSHAVDDRLLLPDREAQ